MTDTAAAPAETPAGLNADMPSCCQAGHSFTKRFHAVGPTAAQLEALEPLTDEDRLSSYPTVPEIGALIEKLTNYTYVCDVCDVCGFTAGR